MAVDDSGSTFALKALSHPLADPERVCRYLQNTLTGLVDLLERAPQTPIEILPVLPRAERHMVLEEWNRTDTKFERGTLDALFSAQARKTPNAVAVINQNGTALTYAELDEQSTRLARQLVAQGIRNERVVGVRMDVPRKPSSRFWPSSKQAESTCPSIPPIPKSASTTSLPMPAPCSCSIPWRA